MFDQVAVDGLLAQGESLGDRTVRQPFCDKAQHLDLARTQWGGHRRGVCPRAFRGEEAVRGIDNRVGIPEERDVVVPLEHREPRVRQMGREILAVARVAVVASLDDEGRRGDRREEGAQIDREVRRARPNRRFPREGDPLPHREPRRPRLVGFGDEDIRQHPRSQSPLRADQSLQSGVPRGIASPRIIGRRFYAGVRAEDDQPRDTFGETRREGEGNHAALRPAEEGGAPDTDRVHHSGEVTHAGIQRVGVGIRWAVGEPSAPLVVAHDPPFPPSAARGMRVSRAYPSRRRDGSPSRERQSGSRPRCRGSRTRDGAVRGVADGHRCDSFA